MSEPFPIDRDSLLERFLRYVQMDTTANPDTDEYPSSPGQRTLNALLAEELRAEGAEDVVQDEHGLVFATIPATVDGTWPVVALNAHVDTSPDAPGSGVKPQLIECYEGGDITLPGDTSRVIRVSESPELKDLHGCTLVTTDGTTLLGGDDKAGVAIIMETAATLLKNRQLPHGKIRLLFSCDEEVGRGVSKVDLNVMGADACYTLDGPAANTVDVETFSADLAVIKICGTNIHPAIAKDKMVNAIRAVGHFLSLLPPELSPERTENRQGFIHPYSLQGEVDQVTLKILLRDFDTPKLSEYAKMLEGFAQQTQETVPGCEVAIEVANQYRNLGDGLKRHPQVVDKAILAHERLGRPVTREIIRGGTDGSRLTEMGLPTPNLSSGQHNLHSRLEWACLDEMQQACQLLIELAAVWAE